MFSIKTKPEVTRKQSVQPDISIGNDILTFNNRKTPIQNCPMVRPV